MIVERIYATDINGWLKSAIDEAIRVAEQGVSACSDSTARTHFAQTLTKLQQLQKGREMTEPLLAREPVQKPAMAPPPSPPAEMRPDHEEVYGTTTVD